MFFNRNKQQEPAPRVGLSDGIEAKVAAFVKDWGALQRGERDIRSVIDEAPLQLRTDADVALFVKAMEDEAARIEIEIDNLRQSRNSEIAQKDAQIAAINREIEAQKARGQAQLDEIDQRAQARATLLAQVSRIDPKLDVAKITKDSDIRREVVQRKFGAVAVDGKSEAYIDERFESLVARANVDPFARVVADGLISNALDTGRAAADRAYADYVSSLTEAHRTKH